MHQHVILETMVIALEKWYEFQKDPYSKLTYKDPRKFGYQNQNMIIWMMDSLKQSWYTNSGCSKHMAGDASKFIHISPKNSEYLIYGDNKQRPLDQQAQQVISNDTNKSLVFDWLLWIIFVYDC